MMTSPLTRALSWCVGLLEALVCVLSTSLFVLAFSWVALPLALQLSLLRAVGSGPCCSRPPPKRLRGMPKVWCRRYGGLVAGV